MLPVFFSMYTYAYFNVITCMFFFAYITCFVIITVLNILSIIIKKCLCLLLCCITIIIILQMIDNVNVWK